MDTEEGVTIIGRTRKGTGREEGSKARVRDKPPFTVTVIAADQCRCSCFNRSALRSPQELCLEPVCPTQ